MQHQNRLAGDTYRQALPASRPLSGGMCTARRIVPQKHPEFQTLPSGIALIAKHISSNSPMTLSPGGTHLIARRLTTYRLPVFVAIAWRVEPCCQAPYQHNDMYWFLCTPFNGLVSFLRWHTPVYKFSNGILLPNLRIPV